MAKRRNTYRRKRSKSKSGGVGETILGFFIFISLIGGLISLIGDKIGKNIVQPLSESVRKIKENNAGGGTTSLVSKVDVGNGWRLFGSAMIIVAIIAAVIAFRKSRNDKNNIPQYQEGIYKNEKNSGEFSQFEEDNKKNDIPSTQIVTSESEKNSGELPPTEEVSIEVKNYILLNEVGTIVTCKCNPLIGLNAYGYEQKVASWLRASGYRNAQVTRKSVDYGADIIGTGLNGEKMCAQCKMYNNPVGVKPIQEIVAAKGYYNCETSMVITTSGFTDNAKALARANHVKLVIYSDRI